MAPNDDHAQTSSTWPVHGSSVLIVYLYRAVMAEHAHPCVILVNHQ
jgi:hypothetical protein